MLVTLKSTTHDNGISTDESAANWTNFFKEGIHFSPASTVQVVSCSINKTDDFIIEKGVNDQFLYAIGKSGPLPPYAQGPFSQHRITIPAGGYTGTTLAAKIQQLLKNSTTLGTMKDTWAVYYNPAGAATPANFMIEWNQLTPAIPYDLDNYATINEPSWRFIYPGAPASTWVREVIQLGEPNTIHAKLDQDRLTFNDLGGDDNIGIGGLISDGTDILGVNLPHGTIHAGEGNIVLSVPPTNIIGEYDLTLVGDLTLNNWLGVGLPVTATATQVNASLYNGYEYSLEVPNTDTGTINVLTPLAGADGLRTVDIPVGQGGSNWQVNAIGTVIPFLGPGGGPGAGASFKVLTVDEDDTMGPPTLALLTVAVQLPGVNYVVGNTIELVNPNPPPGGGTGNAMGTVSAVRQFTGDNLDVGAVLNIVNVSAFGPWGDDQAQIQILTVGPGGIYSTSQFWTRGATYTAGQIVYANMSGGNNPYFTITSVMDGFDVWFAHVTEEGAMGMVIWDYPHDATQPTQPDAESNHSSQWHVGFKLGGDENFPLVTIDGTGSFLYEINLFESTGVVGALYGDGLPNQIDPAAIWIGDTTNQLLPLAFTPIYPTSQVGYTRYQLRAVYTSDDADLYVSLVTTEDNLDVVVEIRQLQMIGNSFPNGTMIQIYQEQMSVEMPLFQMGDWISAAIKIDNYTNVSVVLSHDTQGNNVWLDNTIADTNSLDPVPNQLVPARTTWESNLRECMYPLRPIINTNIGTGFDPTSLPRAADIVDGMATPYFSAMVDAKNVDPYSHFKWEYDHSTLVTGTSMDDSEFEPVPIPVAGTPLLPWFYKFSQLRDLDISDAIDRDDSQAERALWDGLVDPNTANMGKTLAMFDVYNFDNAPSVDGLIASDPDKYPQPDTRNPTIQIELPDFGIKSFSGASHDTGRAIAAIPREQFTTDERSGTLHYESNYPVVINLNCKDNIVLNHISCRMRQLDGKLAVLQNPTQVTILIKDNDESVQSRAFEKALDRMEQKKADRETNRIANMNNGVVPIM